MGSVTLTSSQPDASGGKRNPTHALELTEEQANRAATVLFDDISEFTVEFAAIGTKTRSPGASSSQGSLPSTSRRMAARGRRRHDASQPSFVKDASPLAGVLKTTRLILSGC